MSLLTIGHNGLAGTTIHLVGEFLGKISGQDTRLFQIDLHTLKAKFECGLDVINDNITGHISHQLGGIQFIVGAVRLEDCRLLFQGKVGIRKGGINVLFEKIQDLIVGNHTRVGKFDAISGVMLAAEAASD